VHTPYHCFARTAAAMPGKDFLGHRPVAGGTAGDFRFETYGQALEETAAIGVFLAQLGLAPGATVGIFAMNRPEWTKSADAPPVRRGPRAVY
jgi:long-subunit acyl-CoA synthetase (AMP-forming)